MEGMRLCRALWTGKPVDWDGRWHVEQGVIGPTPHQPGGPPIWVAGSLPAAWSGRGGISTAGYRTGPTRSAGASSGPRCRRLPAMPAAIRERWTGAIYLTPAVDENTSRADAKLASYLEHTTASRPRRCGARQAVLRRPGRGVAEWLNGYAEAGASHLVLRFAGDHERHLETLPAIRAKLGW